MAKLPIYKVVLSEDDEGMDFNSFVDYPAHSKAFELFDKKKPSIQKFFNNEQRIVTGVAISTNQPIYRVDDAGREYYLFFDAPTVKAMAQRMFEKGYMHNVNEMHESNRQLKSITLVESYFIDYKRGVNPPNAFKNQNLQDGTWIVSYKVNDLSTWEKLKSGVYQGFSIESWFSMEKVNFKNQSNMNKPNLWDKLKAVFTEVQQAIESSQTFGEATTTDGNLIKWEGELKQDTIVYLVAEDGTEILAPEGTHSIVDDAGVTTVITLNAEGMVTTLEVVGADGAQDDTAMVEEMRAMFTSVLKEIKSLKNENATFKSQIKTLTETLDKGKPTTKKVDANEKFKSVLKNSH
jgi:hypothetical protein